MVSGVLTTLGIIYHARSELLFSTLRSERENKICNCKIPLIYKFQYHSNLIGYFFNFNCIESTYLAVKHLQQHLIIELQIEWRTKTLAWTTLKMTYLFQLEMSNGSQSRRQMVGRSSGASGVNWLTKSSQDRFIAFTEHVRASFARHFCGFCC